MASRDEGDAVSVAQDERSDRRVNQLVLVRKFVWPVLAKQQRAIWAVTLFPLFFVLAMVLGKIFTPRLYQFLIREDSLVEYATCIAYMLACFFAVALTRDLRCQDANVYALLYALLSTGLFLIAMEEISWGQRIFDTESPELFSEFNWKGETNFHNIYGFPLHKAFITVGFYGAFSRMLLLKEFKSRHPTLVELLTPAYSLFFYFFFTFALYFYFEYINYTYLEPRGLQWSALRESFVTGKDQEPIELLLALGFLLFVLINRYRYQRD